MPRLDLPQGNGGEAEQAKRMINRAGLAGPILDRGTSRLIAGGREEKGQEKAGLAEHPRLKPGAGCEVPTALEGARQAVLPAVAACRPPRRNGLRVSTVSATGPAI